LPSPRSSSPASLRRSTQRRCNGRASPARQPVRHPCPVPLRARPTGTGLSDLLPCLLHSDLLRPLSSPALPRTCPRPLSRIR
jgi:hypothetical protein